jgi:hypothetical protein
LLLSLLPVVLVVSEFVLSSVRLSKLLVTWPLIVKEPEKLDAALLLDSAAGCILGSAVSCCCGCSGSTKPVGLRRTGGEYDSIMGEVRINSIKLGYSVP